MLRGVNMVVIRTDRVFKFDKDMFVRFRGSLGVILDKKLIVVPSPMLNYNLYLVEFEDTNREWINEMYLVKG